MHPLIHPVLFIVYLSGLAIGLVFLLQMQARSWRGERARVRAAICRHLQLPDDSGGWQAVADQLLCFVPAVPVHLLDKFEPLRDGGRVWMAFLKNETLFVSGQTGTIVVLTPFEMRRPAIGSGPGDAGFHLAIELGGSPSVLRVDRLDDMVRIMNVLMSQGIALKHLPPKLRRAGGFPQTRSSQW